MEGEGCRVGTTGLQRQPGMQRGCCHPWGARQGCDAGSVRCRLDHAARKQHALPLHLPPSPGAAACRDELRASYDWQRMRGAMLQAQRAAGKGFSWKAFRHLHVSMHPGREELASGGGGRCMGSGDITRQWASNTICWGRNAGEPSRPPVLAPTASSFGNRPHLPNLSLTHPPIGRPPHGMEQPPPVPPQPAPRTAPSPTPCPSLPPGAVPGQHRGMQQLP